MSDKDGIKSDKDGIVSDKDGTASDSNGIAFDNTGIASDKDGIESDKHGIESDKDGIMSDKDGIMSDKHGIAFDSTGIEADNDGIPLNSNEILTGITETIIHTISSRRKDSARHWRTPFFKSGCLILDKDIARYNIGCQPRCSVLNYKGNSPRDPLNHTLSYRFTANSPPATGH